MDIQFSYLELEQIFSKSLLKIEKFQVFNERVQFTM